MSNTNQIPSSLSKFTKKGEEFLHVGNFFVGEGGKEGGRLLFF